MKEIQEIVRRLAAGGGPSVLATLVSVEGSSYRRAGARALFTPATASRFGSISGGCLEEDLQARASRVAAAGQPELAVYDTTSENDLVWGVGLGCHGIVRVLIEPLPHRPDWLRPAQEALGGGPETILATRWQPAPGRDLGTFPHAAGALTEAGVYQQRITAPTGLWIFGAGDDAQPLARMAAELGWAVTIADPRSASARQERFPTAAAVIAAPVSELLRRATAAAGPLGVIMTHHYIHDRPLLEGLLPLPFTYLGLLGPRQRALRLLSEIGQPFPPHLHAPVGFDLGADGAEEVALSILAEMRATLSGRDGRPLRDRTQPIHA